jgi:hypothetical protein
VNGLEGHDRPHRPHAGPARARRAAGAGRRGDGAGGLAAAAACRPGAVRARRIDGWLAGPLREWRLDVPDDAEVGRRSSVRVLCRDRPPRRAVPPPRGARLRSAAGRSGAAEFALGGRRGGRRLVGRRSRSSPVRRGPGTIETLWLAWRGPLGLAARQVRREIGGRARLARPLAGPLAAAAAVPARRAVRPRRPPHPRRGHAVRSAVASTAPGWTGGRSTGRRARATPRFTRARTRPSATTRSSSRSIAGGDERADRRPAADRPRGQRRADRGLCRAARRRPRGALRLRRAPGAADALRAGCALLSRMQQAAAGLDYSGREPNFTLALATLATR